MNNSCNLECRSNRRTLIYYVMNATFPPPHSRQVGWASFGPVPRHGLGSSIEKECFSLARHPAPPSRQFVGGPDRRWLGGLEL